MIERVEGTNIFSYAEMSVDFSAGVTLIEGYNHDDGTEEGSGKSAILNAISWCLFGEIPKDVKMDDVVRAGEKSCRVSVLLSNGVQVVRTRKPNDLYINNGADKIKGKDAKETQEMIVQILGMSFKTFCQSVYFAQNYPNKFITANEEEKGKILSEIEDLSQFDRARKETQARIKVLEPQLDLLSRDLLNLERTEQACQEHISGLIQLKGRVETERDNVIANLSRELLDMESTLGAKKASAEQLREKVSEMEKEIAAITQTLSTIDTELAKAEVGYKSIDRIKKSIESNDRTAARLVKEANSLELQAKKMSNPDPDTKCLTCGSILSKADQSVVEAHIAEVRTQASAKIEEANKLVRENKTLSEELQSIEIPTERIAELKDDKKFLVENRSNLQEGLLDAKQVDLEIKQLSNAVESSKKRLEKEQASTTKDFDDKIVAEQVKHGDAILKIADIRKKKEEVISQLAKLNTLKDAFKEVKSYAFKNTLLELNSKANDYLVQLFSQAVQLRFYNESEEGDTSKITCDVTIDGEVRPLGLYSGGQFRRIQLAVDLALSDLISSRNKNSISFRIFDEYMKDLSETSMENVLSVLQNLKGTTLLIEHNSMFKSIVNQIISVELSNGVSKVVESNYESSELEMSKMQ